MYAISHGHEAYKNHPGAAAVTFNESQRKRGHCRRAAPPAGRGRAGGRRERVGTARTSTRVPRHASDLTASTEQALARLPAAATVRGGVDQLGPGASDMGGTMTDQHEVRLDDTDGRQIASATVTTDQEGGSVRAALHVEPGHLPPDARTRLVDGVFEQPGVSPGADLTAAVPAGDAELIDKVRQHTTNPAARRAGATVIVEGHVASPIDSTTEPEH
jgi:hypothetical protein